MINLMAHWVKKKKKKNSFSIIKIGLLGFELKFVVCHLLYVVILVKSQTERKKNERQKTALIFCQFWSSSKAAEREETINYG